MGKLGNSKKSKVTPIVKAYEVLGLAASLFKDDAMIKASAVTIVDEILGELRHNRRLDWLKLRATGDDTEVYWRIVKTHIQYLK